MVCYMRDRESFSLNKEAASFWKQPLVKSLFAKVYSISFTVVRLIDPSTCQEKDAGFC